jgi:uncharacterized small protein (DUF1192 family)
MDIEDLEPRQVRPKPKDLDGMGVAELEAYLAELQAEIERVQAKIASKKTYLAGADAFFKR